MKRGKLLATSLILLTLLSIISPLVSAAWYDTVGTAINDFLKSSSVKTFVNLVLGGGEGGAPEDRGVPSGKHAARVISQAYTTGREAVWAGTCRDRFGDAPGTRRRPSPVP